MKGWQEYTAGVDDQISPLLHTHLYIEHLLERIIRHQLPEPDRLLKEVLRYYYQKLRLVEAMGVLPPNMVEALKEVNHIRNRAAHTKDYRVDVGEVEKVGRTALGDAQCEELRVVADGDREWLIQLPLQGVFGELLALVVELEHAAPRAVRPGS
jgi:hypothetical protein